MNNPCYNCSDRATGCHESCKRYAEWKERNEAVKQQRKAELEASYYKGNQNAKYSAYVARKKARRQ